MYRIPMSEVKSTNKFLGYHFFSPSATRFFSSRYPRVAYMTNDHAYAYFVTSEQDYPRTPRMYTIRRMSYASGNVENVSDMMAYTNSKSATRALEQAVAEYEWEHDYYV